MSDNNRIPELFTVEKGYGAPIKETGKPSRKRRLIDIKGRVPLTVIYQRLIQSKGWNYKTEDLNKLSFYKTRDQALISAILLTGGRINEVLNITKNQIINIPDNPSFKMITNFPVSKRKGGNAENKLFFDYRSEIALPVKGAQGYWSELIPFTELLLKYSDSIPSDAKMFPFTTTRAWQIVDETLGIWCHYLRSVAESHLMRIMKDSVIVGRYMKVNPATLSKYVQAEWRDYI